MDLDSVSNYDEVRSSILEKVLPLSFALDNVLFWS